MNALQQAGFTILHNCKASTCGNMVLRDNLKNTVFAINHKSDIYNISRKSHFYLFTAEKKPTKEIFIPPCIAFSVGGSEEVELVVDITEEREMSKVVLNVDADTIGKQIQSTGSISLYGIGLTLTATPLSPVQASNSRKFQHF